MKKERSTPKTPYTTSKKTQTTPKQAQLALFIGVVRGETLESEKEKVEGLTIEAYEEKADQVLTKISDELARNQE